MAIINGTDAGDFLVGTNDADTISGFGGDDTITGGRGNDLALLGKGNDRFVWNPGDGSDTVLGEAGFDTLEFTGANIPEQFEIRADGANAQLTAIFKPLRLSPNFSRMVCMSAIAWQG